MDKLPAELLLSIFENLHFCEMQECMLVCHLWLNTIRPIALPDTIHITREHTISLLGQFLDLQPSKKAQIKGLVMHSVNLDQEVLGSCQEYFPNVRSLYLEGGSYITSLERLGEQNTQRKANFISWITKIEALEQYGGYPINQCLLAIGTYSALKTLAVKTSTLLKYGTNVDLNVDLLVNAPNITRLTLGGSTISISYLEKTHSNLLLLKSLELEEITLGPSAVHETITPELVTPSDGVTTLLINTFHDDPNGETETILEFLRYMRYKYTNLREFRFLMNSLRPVSNPNEQMIFTNEMLPLIEHIGSKARLLEINCSSMLFRLLELMNSSGFQAQCLKLSSTCSNLNKLYSYFFDKHSFIRELTLNVNSTKWIPRFLLLMESIKVLNIKGMNNFQYRGQHTIYLQEILDFCSDSLNSLRIEKFHVEDAFHSLSQSYPLNKLQIHTRYISLSAYNFISRCLPHLRHLELGLLEITNGDIKLDSLSLYRLDLHLRPRTYVKITTNMDNRIRYFFTPSPSVASVNWKVSDHCCIWDTLHQIAHEKARVHSDEMICVELNSVQLLHINNTVTR